MPGGHLYMDQATIGQVELSTGPYDPENFNLATKGRATLAAQANVDVNSAPVTIDSMAPNNGDRIFLRFQTAGAENGPWIYNGSGNALTRPPDFDSSADVRSQVKIAISGGTDAGKTFRLNTADPIVLGTTSLTFVEDAPDTSLLVALVYSGWGA